MLECMFGSLENSPEQINAVVIEKQYLSMTEALRRRYRFLLHLPITTVFEWVEIDLTNIVNQETLFIFKSKLKLYVYIIKVGQVKKIVLLVTYKLIEKKIVKNLFFNVLTLLS